MTRSPDHPITRFFKGPCRVLQLPFGLTSPDHPITRSPIPLIAPQQRDRMARVALPSPGSSISGEQPISLTRFTRAITQGLWLDSWEPPTSFQLSSCHYC